jgi:hypothetical protein
VHQLGRRGVPDGHRTLTSPEARSLSCRLSSRRAASPTSRRSGPGTTDAAEPVVPGERVAKTVRKSQHPLPHGEAAEHVIRQTRRQVDQAFACRQLLPTAPRRNALNRHADQNDRYPRAALQQPRATEARLRSSETFPRYRACAKSLTNGEVRVHVPINKQLEVLPCSDVGPHGLSFDCGCEHLIHARANGAILKSSRAPLSRVAVTVEGSLPQYMNSLRIANAANCALMSGSLSH